MSIAIGDDHVALAHTARRFTRDRCSADVMRAAVDADADGLPPFWGELAGLGWLGLHLPEAVGGEGHGFVELAIVLEELGRVLAPGPFLPTVLASAVLHVGGGSSELVRGLIGELAAGRSIGAVALGRALEGRIGPGGSVTVSGTTSPVLCGALADTLVVPVTIDGRERWCVVASAAGRTTPLAPLDPTRRLAELNLHDVVVADDAQLVGVDRARVEALAVTLASAECAGGAAWCLDTAAEYATVRRQFGRPIGQFQAVKHRCADMLVAVEQARATAWDAALALDGGGEPADVALAAAIAGAIGPEAFASVAKDCIQVLGGIGFTWEHDAHLYLRRAISLRQLLGGPSPWRRATAHAALAGARRRLTLNLPASSEAVRAEVRAVVDEVAALPKEEQRSRLVDVGYLVPHWSPPWGRGAGAVEQLVIDQELRRAHIRVPHLQVGAWAAPTIAAHGTVEQQERWVRPTLLGTLSWCQLFSEPDAGSDLAALTTSATRTEGGWLINGQKVWTSMATEADWGICLVRTDPRAPKHQGISYLIVDMRAAGIDIRPLKEMTGLAMFNEVFFDDESTQIRQSLHHG